MGRFGSVKPVWPVGPVLRSSKVVHPMSSRSQSEFPRPGAAVPWMTQKKTKADTPRKEDPLIFHQEIMSFVRYIKLSSDEKEQRNAVVDSLTKVITKIYPSARVRSKLNSFKDEFLPPNPYMLLIIPLIPLLTVSYDLYTGRSLWIVRNRPMFASKV